MTAEHDGSARLRPKGPSPEVRVWSTAAAGPPSIERVRSSIDDAIAAVEAYGAARRAEQQDGEP